MIKAKLFWRVLGNFAFFLIVLTAMTLLTLNVLSKIEENFAIATGGTNALADIEQLRNDLADAPEALNEYLYLGKPEARHRYEEALRSFDSVLSRVRASAPDTITKRTVDDARALFGRWLLTYGNKLVVLHDEDHDARDFTETVKAAADTESQEHYLMAARSAIRLLYDQRTASQPLAIARATTLSSELGGFIAIVNVLLALFAVALGFVLTRSITTPVRLLKGGTQSIMSGHFQPIEMKRGDELGELASDFNRMAVMLGNNYHRLQAYSELVTALNTHEMMEEVQSKSLELLCRFASASNGALYLLNPDINILELTAGYALRQGGRSVKSFAIGDGIPGQCASERRTLEVSDVAKAAGFVIDTGMVEVVPQHVVAVPIFFQEKVIGVIVLGSLHGFGELEKEIINNSVPQIGVAITNARNYEATQKLSREVAGKNEELNGKNAELEKAYRVKSDFLASMSHELRTPLNSIIGFSSVLLGQSGDPLTEDQRKAIEKVLKNGRHLLQLINDILDFSKIESGRMSVSVETDDVANVVSNSVMTVESLVKAKNLTLSERIAPGLPTLNTDVLKVKQILVNLLSNAVKFTEQGEITVTAVQQSGLVLFAVRDSGIGIERKNFDKVFEEFQQIDNSNTRKYKGTGLGLPISRRLARLLGGDLMVDSVFGQGSTFTLAIPAVYKGEEISEPVRTITPQQQAPKSSPSAPASRPAAASSGQVILCIDDDPDVIEILRQYLGPEGYSVTEALNGDDGVRLAAKLKPALITLDIMMPQKDGWQVLRELKQNPETKDIPVIIHSIIENRPLALSLGAVDVIAKPADPKRLLALVEQSCQKSGQYVLVVDDNEDFSFAIQRLLEAEGFAARTASSGKKAIEIIRESAPAIIFLDLVMPDMDGFQVVQQLQQQEAWRSIPVVILSGKELSRPEWDRLNKHITEFMKKSEFSPETITAAAKRILHRD